jgi:hypothetical protein
MIRPSGQVACGHTLGPPPKRPGPGGGGGLRKFWVSEAQRGHPAVTFISPIPPIYKIILIIILIILLMIILMMIINMLMPVKSNSFTHLSVLTDRGTLGPVSQRP